MNINDKYCEYRKLWGLASQRKILTKVPIHLDIELTNRCNLKCKMCWQSEHLSYKKGDMDFELFKRIINEGVEHGVKALKLQSRGESTIYPQILEAISYAKNKGILDIQLTTNAIIFSDLNIKDYLNCGLNLLIFSVDEDHAESYNQLYKNSNYDRVIENINKFLEINSVSSNKIKTRLQITCNDKYMSTKVLGYKELLQNKVDLLSIAEKYIHIDDTKGSSIINLEPCSYPWQRMVINYDGIVSVCCRDYNCDYVMGSINDQSIEDIWLGEKYSNFRKIHLNKERYKIPMCKICNE